MNPLQRLIRGTRTWALLLVMTALLQPARSHAEPTPLPAGAVLASDPWNAVQIIRPAELAKLIAGPAADAPLLLHVGFKPLFRGGAIPGSRYVGPGRTAEGIASLKRAVKGLPNDRSIVLYCGCCPWDHCPNMRPAFKAMRQLGFTHVRALYITKNLDTDWVDKGFPIETPKR